MDAIKRARPSLTGTCQGCDKSFHIECLIVSAVNGSTACPMCRCRWPVQLTDADTELFWTCEKCDKEFSNLERCEAHEAKCGKSFIRRFFSK